MRKSNFCIAIFSFPLFRFGRLFIGDVDLLKSHYSTTLLQNEGQNIGWENFKKNLIKTRELEITTLTNDNGRPTITIFSARNVDEPNNGETYESNR